MAIFRDKVKALETFEQVMVDKLGYQAEHFGKVHLIILAEPLSHSPVAPTKSC